jgi:DNA-binding NarL/FixJ family response regulator
MLPRSQRDGQESSVIFVKRIFLVTNQSMFGRGIERLLEQEARFDIVGQEADTYQALAYIQQLRPDVVILDTRSLRLSLVDKAQLVVIEILRLVPGIKVIGLNLNENTFHIYRSAQREANDVSDLMNAINEE